MNSGINSLKYGALSDSGRADPLGGGRVARWLVPRSLTSNTNDHLPVGNNVPPTDVQKHLNSWRAHMPILLWLVGVPISIIVLLMVFGVLHI